MHSEAAMSDVPYNPVLKLKLSNYPNTPFIRVMNASQGIYFFVGRDAETKATVPSVKTVLSVLNTQLVADAGEIYNLFVQGQQGVSETLTRIAGIRATSQEMRKKVEEAILSTQLKNPNGIGWAAALLTDPLLFACPSYVEVELNSTMRNYHVAYIPPDVKSGRSYSLHGGELGTLDPSDMYYLRELNLLQTQSMLQPYLSNVIQFLVSSNTSSVQYHGYFSDFAAIYTAELIRYAMANYRATNCWAVDLAKVTFLTAYVNPSAMLILNGQFVSGNITNYADKGSIGDRKSDYDRLSRWITSYLRKNFLSEVQQLEASIQINGTMDILGSLLEYLVKPDINPDSNLQNSIINQTNALMNTIMNNYQNITAYINQYGSEIS